jgi:hypothetical protein
MSVELLRVIKEVYLPPEIVNIIADYHDYDKYCKPSHNENFKGIINDIGDMAIFQDIEGHNMSPAIAWQCWGIGSYKLQDQWGTWDANMEGWNAGDGEVIWGINQLLTDLLTTPIDNNEENNIDIDSDDNIDWEYNDYLEYLADW